MKVLTSFFLIVGALGGNFLLSTNTWAHDLAKESTQIERNCALNPCYNGLIDLDKAEEVYLKVSNNYDQEAVFYSSDVPHAQSLHNSILRLTNRYNANVGFVVFDHNGLAFLKNNMPFPVENMKGFYVCSAAAAKAFKENIPFDYKIVLPLNELKYTKDSNLYQAILKSNFLQGNNHGVAVLDIINTYKAVSEEANDKFGVNLNKFNAFHALTSDATVEQWLIQGWIEHAQANGIKQIEISLSDLIYYGMNEEDELAIDLLVNKFLGGKENVEKFLFDRGLKFEPYTLLSQNGQKSNLKGSKGYRFATNNYYNARFFSTFINDQSLSAEIKDLILQAMTFASRSQGFLSEGIKQSIDHSGRHSDDYAKLKIFDLNSFTKSPDNRWTATTLAYVEFLGHPYVISIGIDNISGEEGKSKEQAQIMLQKIGTILFDHLHINQCPRGSLIIRNPI